MTGLASQVAEALSAGPVKFFGDVVNDLRVPANMLDLKDLYTFFQSINPVLVLIGFCLNLTPLVPAAKSNFLLHYWVTFLGGFAGNIISAVLIMVGAKQQTQLCLAELAGHSCMPQSTTEVGTELCSSLNWDHSAPARTRTQ